MKVHLYYQRIYLPECITVQGYHQWHVKIGYGLDSHVRHIVRYHSIAYSLKCGSELSL